MQFPSVGLGWNHTRKVLVDILAKRELATATEYASGRPMEPLEMLAGDLGIAKHCRYLEMKLWEEAAESGQIQRCARDMLARDLARYLRPDRPIYAIDIENALHSWRSRLPLNYKQLTVSLHQLLQASAPSDWTPADADDPVLLDAFRGVWPAHSPDTQYCMIVDSRGGITIMSDP